MAIWLPLVLAGLVTGSQFVTNPEDLGKRFARAQNCWRPAILPGRSGYTRAYWPCRMGR